MSMVKHKKDIVGTSKKNINIQTPSSLGINIVESTRSVKYISLKEWKWKVVVTQKNAWRGQV